jgi:hypothetical protein
MICAPHWVLSVFVAQNVVCEATCGKEILPAESTPLPHFFTPAFDVHFNIVLPSQDEFLFKVVQI